MARRALLKPTASLRLCSGNHSRSSAGSVFHRRASSQLRLERRILRGIVNSAAFAADRALATVAAGGPPTIPELVQRLPPAAPAALQATRRTPTRGYADLPETADRLMSGIAHSTGAQSTSSSTAMTGDALRREGATEEVVGCVDRLLDISSGEEDGNPAGLQACISPLPSRAPADACLRAAAQGSPSGAVKRDRRTAPNGVRPSTNGIAGCPFAMTLTSARTSARMA